MPRETGAGGHPWAFVALGLAMEICFASMILLGDLRQHTVPFLWLYGGAFLFYSLAVWGTLRWPERRSVTVPIWGLAIVFRLTLLFTTPPTLSDDVYRYIWDGRLVNAGQSPYALPVASPLLDGLDSPLRALVNNNWMASPYLPAAQALFAGVYRLAPESPLAFQIAALGLDMLTGFLVFGLLRLVGLSGTRVLIYLWNPLVVVEFAHGAHIDALMICLMMVALWALVAAGRALSARVADWLRLASVLALAAATLTKGLPLLLLPVVARRWGWRNLLIYGVLVSVVLIVSALGPGWGLSGEMDGTGLFGALRIYANYWNYNGGLYHWLEVALSGYPTSGAVPVEAVGWGPIRAAKWIVGGALVLVLAAVWWACRRCGDDLTLLRLSAVPLAAYLLLATTVHPWYVTLLVPLLPFLAPRKGEATQVGRFLVPALYFTAAVALSYTRYMDPANLREYDAVRLVEYLPVYLLLIWAAWPATGVFGAFGRG